MHGSSSPLGCIVTVDYCALYKYSYLHTLRERGLLDPINPAYNQSRRDGRLELTASAFNRLWISMLAVLVAVPTVTHNSLHTLSTSCIIAHHLLDFMVHGKTTEADALTTHLDATPSGLLAPPRPSFSHFYAKCPFCCNPPNLSCLGTGTK